MRTEPQRRRVRRRRSERASTLDARAAEVVARFVRILARCGCTPEDIGREVLKACRQVPKSWVRNAMAAVRDMDAAAHVLTLWFSDPAYLDARGNPRPLALRGPQSSLEALVLRVDPKLQAAEVLRYLQRPDVLRRAGTRYLPPPDRVLSFRGSGGPYNSRSLRSLSLMLRTLEHNSEPERSTPGWFEVFALNPRLPMSALAAFDRRVRRLGMRLLVRPDADMHRRERARQRGERTVPVGVGIYRFEEEPVPRERGATRTSRPQK